MKRIFLHVEYIMKKERNNCSIMHQVSPKKILYEDYKSMSNYEVITERYVDIRNAPLTKAIVNC